MINAERAAMLEELVKTEQAQHDFIESEFILASKAFDEAQSKRQEALKSLRDRMGRAFEAIANA